MQPWDDRALIKRIARSIGIVLLGLFVLPPPAFAAAPDAQPVAFVRLRAAKITPIPDSQGGGDRLVATVTETFYGHPAGRRIEVNLNSAVYSSEGTEFFALVETGRPLSIWLDTTEVGLCVLEGDVEEFFDPDPALKAALEKARRKYPCREVPDLKFSTRSGVEVTVESRSMSHAKVRRRSASIAGQVWSDLCRRYPATCATPSDYRLGITLFPQYCIVMVSRRNARTPSRFDTVRWYRCNRAYVAGPDRAP